MSAHADNKPPRDLPDHAVKTVIQDVAGNLIVLDSEQDKESLSLRSPWNNMWMVLGDYSVGD